MFTLSSASADAPPYSMPVSLPAPTASPPLDAAAPYTPAVLSLIAQLEPSNPPAGGELSNADLMLHRSEEHTSELQSLRHLVCRPRSTLFPYTTSSDLDVHVVVCVCGRTSVLDAGIAARADGVTAARRRGSLHACGAEPDRAARAEQPARRRRALERGPDAARHAGEHDEWVAGAADVLQSEQRQLSQRRPGARLDGDDAEHPEHLLDRRAGRPEHVGTERARLDRADDAHGARGDVRP